jgi:hypothetical protein
MIKYSDMVEVQSTKTGEIKQIPSKDLKNFQDGVKTAEAEEWKVINEEGGSIRTEGSGRQEAI